MTIIDGSAMSFADFPYIKEGESLALADVKIHVLSDGYKFDFKSHQVVIPPRKQHRASPAKVNENGKTKNKKVRRKRNSDQMQS